MEVLCQPILCFFRIGQGIAVAGEEQHGHLQKIIDRGFVDVDLLPGQFHVPFVLDVDRQVVHVVAVPVPLLVGVAEPPALGVAVIDLGHSARPAALGEEEQGQTGGNIRIGFGVAGALPKRLESLWRRWLEPGISRPRDTSRARRSCGGPTMVRRVPGRRDNSSARAACCCLPAPTDCLAQ